jgi:hypothetical protein
MRLDHHRLPDQPRIAPAGEQSPAHIAVADEEQVIAVKNDHFMYYPLLDHRVIQNVARKIKKPADAFLRRLDQPAEPEPRQILGVAYVAAFRGWLSDNQLSVGDFMKLTRQYEKDETPSLDPVYDYQLIARLCQRANRSITQRAYDRINEVSVYADGLWPQELEKLLIKKSKRQKIQGPLY